MRFLMFIIFSMLSLSIFSLKKYEGIYTMGDFNKGDYLILKVYSLKDTVNVKVIASYKEKQLQGIIGNPSQTISLKGKDYPMEGLDIVWGLKAYKDYLDYGSMMNPKDGSTISTQMWLDSKGILQMKPYWGILSYTFPLNKLNLNALDAALQEALKQPLNPLHP